MFWGKESNGRSQLSKQTGHVVSPADICGRSQSVHAAGEGSHAGVQCAQSEATRALPITTLHLSSLINTATNPHSPNAKVPRAISQRLHLAFRAQVFKRSQSNMIKTAGLGWVEHLSCVREGIGSVISFVTQHTNCPSVSSFICLVQSLHSGRESVCTARTCMDRCRESNHWPPSPLVLLPYNLFLQWPQWKRATQTLTSSSPELMCLS